MEILINGLFVNGLHQAVKTVQVTELFGIDHEMKSITT